MLDVTTTLVLKAQERLWKREKKAFAVRLSPHNIMHVHRCMKRAWTYR